MISPKRPRIQNSIKQLLVKDSRKGASLTHRVNDLSSLKEIKRNSSLTGTSLKVDSCIDLLKIHEAYQFLMLRDIGCSRKQAISLASKFKLSKLDYLSTLPLNFKKRLKQTYDEDKYQIFTSTDDEIEYMNLTKLLQKTTKNREAKTKYPGQTSPIKPRRINLHITKRNLNSQNPFSLISQNHNKFSLDDSSKTQEKLKLYQNSSLDQLPNLNNSNKLKKFNSDQQNLRKVKKDFFSIRRNSLQSPSESDEENYQKLLEKEKELIYRIKKHKLLLAQIKKSKVEEKKKISQEQKRKQDKLSQEAKPKKLDFKQNLKSLTTTPSLPQVVKRKSDIFSL